MLHFLDTEQNHF